MTYCSCLANKICKKRMKITYKESKINEHLCLHTNNWFRFARIWIETDEFIFMIYTSNIYIYFFLSPILSIERQTEIKKKHTHTQKQHSIKQENNNNTNSKNLVWIFENVLNVYTKRYNNEKENVTMAELKYVEIFLIFFS